VTSDELERSWPFGQSSHVPPERRPKLQKALAYMALGEDDASRLSDLIGWDDDVQALKDVVTPSGSLTKLVYRYWLRRAQDEGVEVSQLLADHLSLLGLDRLIVEWDLDGDAVARLLASEPDPHSGPGEPLPPGPSREGTLLRLLLWAADPGRSGPRRVGLLPDYFARTFRLPGRLIAGDGTLALRRTAHVGLAGRPAPVIVTSYDQRSEWRAPFQGSLLGTPEHTLHILIRALGWRALFRRRLDDRRNVWNGRLARLNDARFENPDDRPQLHLDFQPTDYVATVGTNFDSSSWVEYLDRVAHDGTAWIADELGRQLDRWNTGAPLPAEDTSEFAATDAPEIKELIHSLRAGLPLDGVGDLAARVRERELSLLRSGNLRDSQFANPLSVNMTYVTRDGYILIQQRNKEQVGYGSVDWQTSAAGFVATPRDYSDHFPQPAQLDVWKAAENETEEELGAPVDPESTVFLGVVREGRSYEVGLVGYGRLQARVIDITATPRDEYGEKRVRLARIDPAALASWDRHDVKHAIVLPGTDQATEVKDFVAVEAKPEAFFTFVREHGSVRPQGKPWSSWMPLGAYSILSMLAHLNTQRDAGVRGWDLLGRAWDRVNGDPE
jgi:hypothetical protein